MKSFILPALLIFLLSACSSAALLVPPTPNAEATETKIAEKIFATLTASAPTATATARATPTSTATTTPQVIGKWRVSYSQSSFDDSQTVVLKLDAEKPVKGWLDSYLPTLILRCQEGATDAYVIVGMQQAVESTSDTSTVRVRLDNLAAKSLMTDHSTDGKALFFRSPRQFISDLVARKQMVFGFTPYNAAPVETTFVLDGLAEANKLLLKACPKN